MGDFNYMKEYEPGRVPLKSIQKFMKENTGPHRYPREIDFVKELPKTQSGKIERRLLREAEIEKKKKV